MRKIALSITVLFALTSAASFADQSQTTPQPAVQPAAPQTATTASAPTAPVTTASSDSDKVCGVGYHDGDIVNKKICITKSEQKFNKQQTHQNIRELQTRSLTSNTVR